jgi:peptidoglycan/LPS O-acetylase OafA/YrhL
LLFLQDYLPASLNVAFWSLGVEEKFYLTAPILMWAVLTRRRFAAGMTLLAAVLTLSPVLRAATYASIDAALDYEAFFPVLRSPFHASLEPLMIGVMIAVVQHAGYMRLSPRAGTRVFAAALAASVALLCSHELMAAIGWFDATVQPLLIALICGMLTLGAVVMKPVHLPGELLARPIARLSYCLYLVHLPAVPLAAAMAGGNVKSPSLFWIAYLAVSIAFAVVLHFGVEKPFLVVKDRLAAAPDRSSARTGGRLEQVLAAGDLDLGSGDIGGVLGTKVIDRPGDILRRAHAVERDA